MCKVLSELRANHKDLDTIKFFSDRPLAFESEYSAGKMFSRGIYVSGVNVKKPLKIYRMKAKRFLTISIN